MNEYHGLSKPLQLLYAISGATLSLPSLALSSLINDQIGIPVKYLSAYYAVAFLPYSLKPMYSFATHFIEQRLNLPLHLLLVSLLVASGIVILSFSCLSRGDTGASFVLSFANGLCISWSELILGFIMIHTNQQQPLYYSSIDPPNHDDGNDNDDDSQSDDLSSKTKHHDQSNRQSAHLSLMQTQAATSKNVGSYIASFASFLVLLYYQYNIQIRTHSNDDGNLILHGTVINTFFVLTAFLPWSSAIIVLYYKQTFTLIRPTQERNLLLNNSNPCNHIFKILSFITFQLSLIVAALRNLIIEHLSTSIWNILFVIVFSTWILSTFIILVQSKTDPTSSMHASTIQGDASISRLIRICIFILVRNAIPTATVMLSSFTYSTFRSRPLFLQVLYILQMLMITFATWVYQTYIAKYQYTTRKLVHVIVYFTILQSICTVAYMVLLFPTRSDISQSISSSLLHMIFFILVTLCYSFAEELSFLPNLILATITSRVDRNDDINIQDSAQQLEDYIYASLLSCIDFGDQISAWITVPLIDWLDIRRDNGWTHLPQYLLICTVAAITSLLLLRLISFKED